ncbi:MAG: hypothetical protein ACPGR8_16860, partial [Limisphaerales bacterium]
MSPANAATAGDSTDDSDYDPRDPLAALSGDSDADTIGEHSVDEEDGVDSESLNDGDGDDDDDDDGDDDGDDDAADDAAEEEVTVTVLSLPHGTEAILDGKKVTLHLDNPSENASVIVVSSPSQIDSKLVGCINHDNTAAAVCKGEYVARVIVQGPPPEDLSSGTLAVVPIEGKDEVAMIVDVLEGTGDTPEWATLVRECENGSAKGLSKADRKTREAHAVSLPVKGGKPKLMLYSRRAHEYARSAPEYKAMFERYRANQERNAKRRNRGAAAEAASAGSKQT